MSLSQERMTSRGYVIVRLLSFPFWGLFYLLPMILYKDLHATPFQITTMIALKPIASLFSPYWSQLVHAKQHRIISNLHWANILKFIPFLFFPVINNPWYFIFSFGLYMVLTRGTIPAWMEILKLNLQNKVRSRICAVGSTIDYFGAALLPLSFGWLLDNLHESWRWLFPATALLGMLSSWFITRIPNKHVLPVQISIQKHKSPLSHLLNPWKSCWKILTHRIDFLKFQLGFFLGGAGLMVMQPALPKYFVDTLHLSYTGMLTAMAALKGIGFALSSPLWVRYFNRAKTFVLCSFVTFFAAVFPFLLIGAKSYGLLIYVAYFVYGIMQGGSELSWQMSGPVFSKESDSSPFSSINVLTVGIRGLIFPYFGSFFFILTDSAPAVMLLGATLCIGATIIMALNGRKYEIRAATNI
jgi:MFS family permease